ncbi:MAG: TlpA family protein disulfide reductase [Granulosicoccus sp.]
MYKLLTRQFCPAVVLSLCLCISHVTHAFQLQALDESRVNLMDYVNKDRWTLVMFWATDCIPCEEQKPALEAFHRQHSASLATVVGVAIDGMENREEIDKLNKLHDPSYPNLVVFTDVFHRQYKELVGKPFRTTPTFLVFDSKGQLQGNLYGYIDFDALTQHIATQN